MVVAVIDVGSNTVRLLVADVLENGAVEAVADEKAFLWLGAEIAEHGAPRPEKLAQVDETAGRLASAARTAGAEHLQTIVTAPGRRRTAAPLLSRLRAATGAPVRVLSSQEEGRLAYDGAVARAAALSGEAGVVDVGGGSTEIVVGRPLAEAPWVRSLEIGSLGLTHRRFSADPPSAAEVEVARRQIRDALAHLVPPVPDTVFATGGTARTVARVLGRRYDADDLDALARVLTRRPSKKMADTFGLRRQRARTIVAGTLILAETARLLGRPLERARGGLREGAALSVAAEATLAA